MFKTVFDRIVTILIGAVLFLCGFALVDFLLHPLAVDFTYHTIFYRLVTILVLTPLTLLVGFLIIKRVPGNIVGPLLLLWSGTVAFGSIRLGAGAIPIAIFAFYELTIGWFALFLMVLHFPSGKIYPEHVAPWIYTTLGICILLNTILFFSNETSQAQVANPFYLPALQKWNSLIVWTSILLFSPTFVLAVVSPILRYRKGSYLERQQIKWLVFFGGILVPFIILGFIVYPGLTGSDVMSRGNYPIEMLFFVFIGLFPPIAIGVAILRYHLWDIDIIIRRTLVYGTLTFALALIYFGSVLVLQWLFEILTGRSQSPLVIVLSTLAIAALFNPLRKRIQNDIDRRFYRRKYDVDKMLEAFATSLRQEVNLDEISRSLLAMAAESMQPESLSLWIEPVSGGHSAAWGKGKSHDLPGY